MAKFSIKELLDAGFHFGHQTKRWNPKMKKYIFQSRNSIHIINLQKTVYMLRDAYHVVREHVSRGGTILFVGTKRQVVDIIAEEAKRCGQYYVNHRWLGGTLTNWRTIQGSILHLKDIERMSTDGTYEALPKKEVLNHERERAKMERSLGGIKNMERLPELLVVVDTKKEHIAVREARKLGIPVVALVDTNCDPDVIDHVVPGNDDAIRSLKLFLRKMSDAVLEGSQMSGEEVEVGPEAPYGEEGADTAAGAGASEEMVVIAEA
jgi:small subunit ribosomal protein S2